MNIIVIIKTLLQIVSFLMQKADEKRLMELGKDELVSKQLADVVARTGTAKVIAAHFAAMSDDDVDKFLRDYYRD